MTAGIRYYVASNLASLCIRCYTFSNIACCGCGIRGINSARFFINSCYRCTVFLMGGITFQQMACVNRVTGQIQQSCAVHNNFIHSHDLSPTCNCKSLTASIIIILRNSSTRWRVNPCSSSITRTALGKNLALRATSGNGIIRDVYI